ncbi:MAG: radical SAM protein [Bacteroidetes bacterium]|nr:radical SAM protein [Bacteroidota bacterium]
MKVKIGYNGFELGPVRPPSEARSLILRVTRNCPWNRCKFCSLYKGEKFSLRPVEDIVKDIDDIKHYVDLITDGISKGKGNTIQQIAAADPTPNQNDMLAMRMAFNWVRSGMESIFLQDANTLIVKPDHLVEILSHIKKSFPGVKRITSYARSKTVARIRDNDLRRIAAAGLNRIHIGMESGSDRVLKLVDKGVDKQGHIVAGRKVKRAGIELSLYCMPGLGGEELSQENALETADAINQIDPEFIRIRTLAIPEEIELHKEVQARRFRALDDIKCVEELLLFIESLQGITSTIKSDHILNLLQEVEGRLPDEKETITKPIKRFLAMPEDKQILYMVGRRSGIFSKLDDITDPHLLPHAEQAIIANRITSDNVDVFTAEMMKRFI